VNQKAKLVKMYILLFFPKTFGLLLKFFELQFNLNSCRSYSNSIWTFCECVKFHSSELTELATRDVEERSVYVINYKYWHVMALFHENYPMLQWSNLSMDAMQSEIISAVQSLFYWNQ